MAVCSETHTAKTAKPELAKPFSMAPRVTAIGKTGRGLRKEGSYALRGATAEHPVKKEASING